MSSSALEKTLAILDESIRQGKADVAKTELRRLFSKKIPREHLLQIANLARRVNQPLAAAKALNPLVRGTRRLPPSATNAEKAEYAASLIRLGAIEEALDLLRTIPTEKLPEVLLFRSFALVARWNYRETLPLLRAYLQSKTIDGYQRLVGKANLAAGLVVEREHGEAENVLSELVSETREQGRSLLLGKALELRAQSAFFQRRWKDARDFLSQSTKVMQGAHALDQLLISKWEALVARLEEPGAVSARRNLGSLRDKALLLRHWETVRQCDAYEAIASGDERLALHVYFGTPFDSFRTSFLKDLGFKPEIPVHYLWKIGGKGASTCEMDVVRGEASNVTLKPGQAFHRLLLALTRDFYRPMRFAELHHQLYPKEYFNPASSPERVHRVMRRFRYWFRDHRFPFAISSTPDGYQLTSRRPATLKVSNASVISPERGDLLLARLEQRWPRDSFSAKDAAQELGLSTRMALNVLQRGLKARKISSLGKTRATRYGFKP